MTRKDDAGKPRFSLLPRHFIGEVIKVLEFGAGKYGVDNWQTVAESRRRYYDAALRHIDLWWNGETFDPESNAHHLACASACCAFLIWGDLKAECGE